MKTLIFKPGKRVITIIRIQNSHSICWKIKIDYAETVDAAILMSKKIILFSGPTSIRIKPTSQTTANPFYWKRKVRVSLKKPFSDL